jgi:hypothetical protein
VARLCSLPLAIRGFVEAILLITRQEIGHRDTPEVPHNDQAWLASPLRGWHSDAENGSPERNGAVNMIRCLAVVLGARLRQR